MADRASEEIANIQRIYLISKTTSSRVKKQHSTFVFVLYAATVIVLILLSCIIKKGDDVLWINGHHSPSLDVLFPTITYLGTGFLFVPLLITLLFVELRLCCLTVIIWVSIGLVNVVLKKGLFSHLERPRAILNNDLLHFVPNVEVYEYFSFPSGHAATIFCLAVLSSLLLTKSRVLAILFLVIALTVGYTRVYLLQHFLMDVAAGAAVGVLTTYLWWRFFEGRKLPQWMGRSLMIYRTKSAWSIGLK